MGNVIVFDKANVSKLNVLLQIKTRIANEKYLRSHPEVEMLLSDFLR